MRPPPRAPLVAAWAAGAVLLFLWFRDLRHDDAFITFQYARNLALGNGFVFNPGERVLGTTSPLFALLGAILWRLGGEALPDLAIAVGAVAVAAQAALIHSFLRAAAPVTAAVASLCVLAGLADSAHYLALETNLFAALVLATLRACVAERQRTAGLCMGLAFLCRYDAGLLIPALALWQWSTRRTIVPSTFAWALAVVAPWLVFAQVYFGSVLPHTFGAKLGTVGAVDYLRHYAAVGLALPGLRPSLAVGGAVAAALTGAAVVWSARRCRPWLFVLAYAVAHGLAYSLIGPMKSQHWHMYLPVLVLRVSFLIGLFAWAERLSSRRFSRLALGAAGGLLVLWLAIQLHDFHRRFPDLYWFGERHRRYETVATWLGENVRPNQVFLAREIGTLGYLTGHRMIDPFGLINPTNDWPRSRSREDLFGLIRRHRPDVVLFDSPEDGRFAGEALGYRVVEVFPWQGNWSTLAIRDPGALLPN